MAFCQSALAVVTIELYFPVPAQELIVGCAKATLALADIMG